MDSSTRVILKVETPEYKKVVIETSDGQRYFSDLKALSSVYCYPKTKPDWDKVSADSYGRALIWSSRFEAHIDQVIGLSYKSEKVSERSA